MFCAKSGPASSDSKSHFPPLGQAGIIAREAAFYYDSESPGLGTEFLREIEQCIRSILDYPEAAPVLAGAVRRRLTRRFPYAVLYSIKPARIRVLAVMHLKRRPMYRAGRQ